MFINALTQETLNQLCVVLQRTYGPTVEPTQKSVRFFVIKWCCDHKMIYGATAIPTILNKQIVHVSEQEIASVHAVLKGVYIPEFDSTGGDVIGLRLLTNKLEQFRNKPITILILG